MGDNAGRRGGRWRALVKQVRATETHCYRCGQAIDWAIPYRDEFGNVNTNAGTVEHTLSWRHHPESREDPAALKASHSRCNSEAGDRDPRPGLGLRSRRW